jgi:Ca2+-binding RTX toxin-like protein
MHRTCRGIAGILIASSAFFAFVSPAPSATIAQPDRCSSTAFWSSLRFVNNQPYVHFDGYDYRVIPGTAGNDVLTGTDGMDFIAGGAGDDRIEAVGGHDIVCGGVGRDRINGGAGRDEIYGEADNDFLVGAGGGDWISGGTGADTVSYEFAEKRLELTLRDGTGRIARTTPDVLWQLEHVIGTRFNDFIDARGFPLTVNRLEGRDGQDILYGNDEDFLLGQGGDYNFCTHFPSGRMCTDGNN